MVSEPRPDFESERRAWEWEREKEQRELRDCEHTVHDPCFCNHAPGEHRNCPRCDRCFVLETEE